MSHTFALMLKSRKKTNQPRKPAQRSVRHRKSRVCEGSSRLGLIFDPTGTRPEKLWSRAGGDSPKQASVPWGPRLLQALQSREHPSLPLPEGFYTRRAESPQQLEGSQSWHQTQTQHRVLEPEGQAARREETRVQRWKKERGIIFICEVLTDGTGQCYPAVKVLDSPEHLSAHRPPRHAHTAVAQAQAHAVKP